MTDRARDDALDPETLLRRHGLQSKRRPRWRGHHKIYVGAAAGVGKTYRALQELRERLEAGEDALIGLLETHGRKETEHLSEGLPIFARRQVEYRGVVLSEFDVFGLLERRPSVVLIDELAHTNVPGAEHVKRYEDVDMLLGAGIDVISTMNVQHLESAYDLVARLTGVRVRERVPDWVLRDADEVILVDVTPEVLRERLRHGKIYAADKVERALGNFFTADNLVVLRELALRQVADTVEPEFRHGGVVERIAVAITAHPESARLIRRGARMAQRLGGDWFVVHVRGKKVSREEERHLDACRIITEGLEGAFVGLGGTHFGAALVSFIARERITQVILGASRRSPWQTLLRPSVTHYVLREAQGVDIYIIADERT